jgi:hypothetical protein
MKTRSKPNENNSELRDLILSGSSRTQVAFGLHLKQLRESQQKAGEELSMKNWKRLRSLPVYLIIAGLASACGGAATSYSPVGGTGNNQIGGPIPTPTETAPPVDEPYSAETFSFSVTGNNGTNPVYSTHTSGSATDFFITDNLLRVKVTAGAASNLSLPSGYSAYTGSYGCISYTVSVKDSSGNTLRTQTTNTLAVNSGAALCPSSSTSQTLDFSGVVSNGPHGGVYVTVQANSYDFYCQYWYSMYYAYGSASPWINSYNSFCPMRAVYQTHTATGSIEVQVNGTSF